MFAIAFAAVLAAGGHPSAYLFDQQAIRQHLHMCISSGKWSPFPTKKLGRENRSRARYTEKFKVYCDCRMPGSFTGEMVQCRKCKKWYHSDKCVFVADQSIKWYCSACNTL